MEKKDLFFLRFLDRDVKKSMSYVLQEIGTYIDDWELQNDVPKTSF
ncbi:hypothetical protein [uncultured Cyclobacterium sp.]